MAAVDEAVFLGGWVGELGLVILGAIGRIGCPLDQRTGGIGDGADRGEMITQAQQILWLQTAK